MACSVRSAEPPSPLWGGTDEVESRQGGAASIATDIREASTCPTLAASPPVPPHEGEGGSRRSPILRAREFRRNLTPQEARLWVEQRALRARGFRRQAPFRGYFLDFVCFRRRLVVEVDGGGHGDDIQAAHDLVRDTVLRGQGFLTLRFWNSDVNTNLDGVMTDILGALQSAVPARSL
jgi:very-short-patch-repair endonuclease